VKKLIIGAALTLVSLSIPVLAATTEKYKVKGESASAYFYQSDDCNSTFVGISAYNDIAKDAPGAPTSQKQASAYYSNYNYCTGGGSFAYGSVTDPNFTMSNSLRSATLNSTITVYDSNSGTSKNLDVALTWTGTGDTYRGHNSSHYQGPGYTSNYRYAGSYRDAEVSGSVTLDGTNIITNLSNDATLGSYNNGSVTITRK
jgi:hypothetical protein